MHDSVIQATVTGFTLMMWGNSLVDHQPGVSDLPLPFPKFIGLDGALCYPNSATAASTPPVPQQNCTTSMPNSHHLFPAIPVLRAHLESQRKYAFGHHVKRHHLQLQRTATFETCYDAQYFVLTYRKRRSLYFKLAKKSLQMQQGFQFIFFLQLQSS